MRKIIKKNKLNRTNKLKENREADRWEGGAPAPSIGEPPLAEGVSNNENRSKRFETVVLLSRVKAATGCLDDTCFS